MWLGILKAAFGLGLVIFVHELGHFLVARLCGVKCEKFYIGFDFFGLSLFKFQRGETEYGIGVFPLGGYVKMLGQDDDPRKFAEESERSRKSAEDSTPVADESTAAATEATTTELDPRSYMAQSVPERMAIISAGVIMNVIFACIFAMVAYAMGVKYIVCVVGNVMPGDAAWQAGLQPGDRIVRIGDGRGEDDDQLRFSDLFSGVAFGDRERGVPLRIRREGVEEVIEVAPKPSKASDEKDGRPKIGVAPPSDTKLYTSQPAISRSTVARTGKFEGGDEIVAINGQPIKTHADILAALAAHRSEVLQVAVARESEEANASEEESVASTKTIDVEVPAQPLLRLGLITEMGPITAIQDGSPAKAAGFQPGDQIISVDGEPPGDPITLPARLRERALETVEFSVARPSEQEPITLTATLREAGWYEKTFEMKGMPVTVPALGIAYHALHRVEAVMEGLPAAEAGISAGDQLLKAEFLPADEESDDAESDRPLPGAIQFDGEEHNWAAFIDVMQWLPAGARVKLSWISDGETREAELEPQPAEGQFYPERGFLFQSLTKTRKASSLIEAARLGIRETSESVWQVFQFLNGLGTGQLSTEMLGGPGTIAVAAGSSAQAGIPQLLIFLTLLSANLAVVNFLPIPILDGGHMVFLIYEGIRGKPPSEKVMIGLSYLGLIFILGLMIYVTSLDIQRLFVWLGF